MCWIKVDLETDPSQVDYGSTKRSGVVKLASNGRQAQHLSIAEWLVIAKHLGAWKWHRNMVWYSGFDCSKCELEFNSFVVKL
ncbi:hypothetical protein [Nitrosomonas oligotropha]|uniref:Uncharacterized protein n=1 Tax=Nitrosomonas oligotropha TaxID=42354 RepID=A0A1H8QAF5_9PROT|nr:hypothetical protein [Nitrosomonas oligotropha]SDW71450.1 hypothetical protein SAMN05216300_10954 [Nitrosomonas oligotropha]SEO50904.1 hypothetical protein SAMN05216333_11154 [Nitrosomonas oligotropha]